MLGQEHGGDTKGFFGNDWTGDYYKHLDDGEVCGMNQHERTYQ